MKIFLDDVRSAPDGWLKITTSKGAIKHLKESYIEVISLDHDLGEEKNGTGYDVLLWIEKNVIENGFIPPEIQIHTANPVARKRMEQTLENILKFVNK